MPEGSTTCEKIWIFEKMPLFDLIDDVFQRGRVDYCDKVDTLRHLRLTLKVSKLQWSKRAVPGSGDP